MLNIETELTKLKIETTQTLYLSIYKDFDIKIIYMNEEPNPTIMETTSLLQSMQ